MEQFQNQMNRDDTQILDLLMVFEKWPGAFALYETVERAIFDTFGEVAVKVGKTSVTFSDSFAFAWVSPPLRRVNGWPERCVVVTFGLEHKLEHPRIVVAVEPYPNRWTHHTLVASPEDVDALLLDWLRQSYAFAKAKKETRGRRRLKPE